MDPAWPPPAPDGARRSRTPNYRLRRAVVAVAALALVALGATWALGRGSGDDGTGTDADAPGWDAVVLQDPTSGAITVHDRQGETIGSSSTQLRGLLDVGARGVVVIGLEGSPADDGLGVVDVATGEVRAVEVRGDIVRQVGAAPYLVSFDEKGTVLELVDPAAATVTDLLGLARRDDALADVTTLTADPSGTRIAFTELRGFETIVVPLPTGEPVTLPGSLADIAFDRVLTTTNRGDSVLVDLYGVDGARVGTVEAPTPAAMMLVDASTAIAVAADGTISQIDFGAEEVSTDDALVAALPVPPGSPTDGSYALVVDGAPLADHTRLALFGDRFVAFVGPDGALVRSVDVAELVAPAGPGDPSDACILVTPPGSGPITHIDAMTGSIVTSVTGGAVRGESADRCTVAFDQRSASDVVVGIGTNVVSRRPLIALSPDATAALQTDATGTSVLVLDGDETIDLVDGRRAGVFARR